MRKTHLHNRRARLLLGCALTIAGTPCVGCVTWTVYLRDFDGAAGYGAFLVVAWFLAAMVPFAVSMMLLFPRWPRGVAVGGVVVGVAASIAWSLGPYAGDVVPGWLFALAVWGYILCLNAVVWGPMEKRE